MTAAEPLLIGAYPRDDVKWPDDGRSRRGLVEVLAGDTEEVIGSRQLGDFSVLSPDLGIGSAFALRVTATDGTEHYAQTFRFVVTGDESDVGHYTVGPGVQVERGRWGRKTVSGFEFGATVMCATPASDS